MNKRIVFRHIDHSTVLEDYANKQLKKIEQFLENEREPIFIDLTFEPSKTKEHHKIELRIKTPSYDLVSDYEHQGDPFYDTLDRVIDIMYRRLLEAKDLHKDQRKQGHKKDEDFSVE